MLAYFMIYAFGAMIAISTRRPYADWHLVLAGTLLVFFMGFRFETGCDWYGYLHRWNNFYQVLANWSGGFGGELGFAILMGSLKSMGLPYVSLNVATSLLLVFCYFRFARLHDYRWTIITLLFPIIMVQLGMSGIRQALAGGFLLLSFNAYMHGSKMWVAIWIVIASQFHISAISLLSISFIAGERISSTRLVLAASIFLPLSGLLLGERVDQYQDRYGSNEVTSDGAIFRYALSFLPVPFFYLYRVKLQRFFPRQYQLCLLSALILTALFPLVFLSSIALHRLNYYVVPLSILLCVYVGAVAFKRPIIGHSIALAVYGGYLVSWFLMSGHANVCYVPYENILLI